MEREYKCKYLGEVIGYHEGLQGPWPLKQCEAPEDTTPSFAGKASFEDDSIVYFCRLSTSVQQKCSAYKEGEEVGVINLYKES